ncbi:MAG: hypothetical protein JWN59_1580 [Sphingomonas bacterium]|nr:hypothetical protein [Sphingomonas bacterium]
MCVPGGRLHLRVPEQLADHGQPLAGGDGDGGISVAHVVDGHVLQACPGTQPAPEGLKVRERLAGEGAGDHVRVEGRALDPGEHLNCSLPELHDLGASPGVR